MNIYRAICLVCLSSSISLAMSLVGIAEVRPVNPLEVEIDQSDPVIPLGYPRRELSVFEINRITREMEKLDLAAQAELDQGEGDQAFKLWYRQLKLARAVDVKTEIETLGKVGEIAWKANRSEDLRNIANRAIAIESELSEEPSFELLTALANTYQQLRYLPQAISVWEQILTNNKQQGNIAAVKNNLQTLGRLYLSQFDYPSAAKIYQELLAQAEQESSENPQIDQYLKTLMEIYDRTRQKQQAIGTRLRLIDQYQAKDKAAKIPSLQLAIAHDYVELNQTAKAITAYETASTLAMQTQRLAIAEESLNSLGKLYQTVENQELAIATLTKLLELQRQTYNHYGLINTYDTLGKIYLNSARKQQAKQYFQSALELARELNYKVGYFNQKIDQSDS